MKFKTLALIVRGLSYIPAILAGVRALIETIKRKFKK